MAPKVLSPEEQKYIVGVQANLWTEYISTFRYAEYMLLPVWPLFLKYNGAVRTRRTTNASSADCHAWHSSTT